MITIIFRKPILKCTYICVILLIYFNAFLLSFKLLQMIFGLCKKMLNIVFSISQKWHFPPSGMHTKTKKSGRLHSTKDSSWDQREYNITHIQEINDETKKKEKLACWKSSCLLSYASFILISSPYFCFLYIMKKTLIVFLNWSFAYKVEFTYKLNLM